MNSRTVIRAIEADGWALARITGSHHHFRHPTKPGTVTVPHPTQDLPPGTLRSIERQSGLSQEATMPVRYYPAVIERAHDGFGVFFPDLPGCTSAGATVQEAALAAEEALQGHIEVTAENGEVIPEPSDLDALSSDPEIDESARILVRAEVPGRAARVNITLPEDLLAAIDRHAKRAGYTRSGLLAQAAREILRRPAA